MAEPISAAFAGGSLAHGAAQGARHKYKAARSVAHRRVNMHRTLEEKLSEERRYHKDNYESYRQDSDDRAAALEDRVQHILEEQNPSVEEARRLEHMLANREGSPLERAYRRFRFDRYEAEDGIEVERDAYYELENEYVVHKRNVDAREWQREHHARAVANRRQHQHEQRDHGQFDYHDTYGNKYGQPTRQPLQHQGCYAQRNDNARYEESSYDPQTSYSPRASRRKHDVYKRREDHGFRSQISHHSSRADSGFHAEDDEDERWSYGPRSVSPESYDYTYARERQ